MTTTTSQQAQSPRPTADTAAVELRGVTKTYGTTTAVDGVDLTVRPGEFLTLLGPSGCGKTTVLSVLAGFVTPDAGAVHVDGQDVTRIPPHRRPVNTVFQDYALFPHMSVVDNVAFGLRMDGVGKRDARTRATQALASVDLADQSGQRTTALSGGQRQRVALARALVKQPKVLLLDEPFAALDLRLRQRMQLDLRRLHHDTGTTFVFVTHDQEEASVLSDRVAVLRDGQIEQVGSPEQIYDDPRTRFVAEFIGESNVFDAAARGGELEVAGVGTLSPPAMCPTEATAYAVRPERVRLSKTPTDAPEPPQVVVPAIVQEVLRVAETIRVFVPLDGGARMAVAVPAWGERFDPGERVHARWHRDDARVLAG